MWSWLPFGSGSTKDNGLEEKQKTSEILPEDEYLRAAYLSFKKKEKVTVTGTGETEEEALIQPEPAAATLDADLLALSEETSEGPITVEETASSLEFRRYLHLGASLGTVLVSSQVPKYLGSATRTHTSKLRTHLFGMGATGVFFMLYYHSARYAALGQIITQVENRSRLRKHNKHMAARAQFIYRPAFAIPDRKF
eukprot:TRINITY_DN14948_c0_g1_i1.p1 TRINITY_DN14948_c0_g1~~TRINITY_DN14948_c0_g1_i1.p1  ORF type:complete len:196 (+),score=22.36 TRINITY_DN14948_c0_g1_i1:69-656(+)